MYADGTGLLTDAIHVSRGAWPHPFPTRWHQWEQLGWHSRSDETAACANTVAGQWRSLTALPEHSESGQRVEGIRLEIRCQTAGEKGES